VVDDRRPESDSDLRRRAAWLLGMLAVVAVLFVVVMTQVLGNGGSKSGDNGPGALDSAVAAQSNSPSPSDTPSSHPRPTATSKAAASSSSATRGSTKCPTDQTCILDGDIGNGIDAINAYRTDHGQPAVTGAVSKQAQECARNNGNGCSGGWAETELAKPNGPMAVQKILQFGQLLDRDLKNFEVGWAYDPGAKLYYFAIIRND
jgi:hypothetical protein